MLVSLWINGWKGEVWRGRNADTTVSKYHRFFVARAPRTHPPSHPMSERWRRFMKRSPARTIISPPKSYGDLRRQRLFPARNSLNESMNEGGMRVFGEYEGVRGSWPKPASNSLRIKLIFPAWAGSNETSVTRLMARVWPKTTLEIRKTSLSRSLFFSLLIYVGRIDRREG